MGQAVSWCGHEVSIPGVPLKGYESETAFQIYCATWLRKQLELTRDPRFDHWHHSANERQGARAGFTAKMMGQAKGFPDFLHCGLRVAIELKLPGRKLRPEQEMWLNHFRSLGWTAEMVTVFERFRGIVLGASSQ